jgi:hypothetical protein
LKPDHTEPEVIRQYLLGQASPELSSQLEQQLLNDKTFYEELLISEDELIDEYLSHDLAPAERERFETHFLLAPERQRRLRFARNLKRYADEVRHESSAADAEASSAEPGYAADFESSKTPFEPGLEKRPFFLSLRKNSLLSYSLAAALVLFVGAVSWMVLRSLRSPAAPEQGQVLAVVLTPGLSRDGGEIKKISLPAGTTTLQLLLQLPMAEYATYRAEVFTAERTSLWAKEGLQPESDGPHKFINVPIPAGLLKRDDYSVKLGGQRADGTYEDLASYVFRLN